MRASASQLNIYQSSNKVPCRAIFDSFNDAPNVFDTGQVRSKLKSLPPPSFLVPAILEALLDSLEYKDITSVIPDEADTYCAAYVNQSGGVVLTGDSDLLVRDLGPKGAVTFFNEIESSMESGIRSLTSLVYRPTIIVERLSLPVSHGISSLAFEISRDGHGTFSKLLQQAKSLTAANQYDVEYDTFRNEYSLERAGLNFELAAFAEPPLCLSRLDPRISEFVLQFSDVCRLSGRSETETRLTASTHIFLPFLIDSYEHRNAWEISTDIRQLAYGLMNLIVPSSQRVSSIIEHKKQQANAGGRAILLPEIAEISAACTSVLTLLSQTHKTLPNVSKSGFWSAIAIKQDIDWSLDNFKPIVTRAVMEQLSTLAEPSRSGKKHLTWDIVRYSAQIHGSYYSFRILKQIIDLVVSHGPENSLPGPVLELHHQLESLPKLRDLRGLSSILKVLPLIISIIKCSEPIHATTISQPLTNLSKEEKDTEKGQKKRKIEVTKTSGKKIARKASTNPFGVLEVE